MLPEGEASPPEEFRELLKTRAPVFDLALAEPAAEKLSRFLAELDVARRRTNLTGPLSTQELVDHALESALGEKLVPQRAELIDIGSGAGFPAVPIAIVRPEVGLDNVFAHETSVTNLVRRSADVATARAVGRIDEVLGEAPFLKPGGLFLVWTTRATSGGLARRLARHFTPDSHLAVPESRHKVIAAFRKNVPRGTEEED